MKTPMAVSEQHFVNGNPLQGPFAEYLQQAVFGLGCFWGAERRFWQLEGVFSTAAGYAGGTVPDPDYQAVCSGETEHAEVVLIIFDPTVVSYRDLLKVFWESHDPTQGMRQGNDIGSQYRSVIYANNDAQTERHRTAVSGRISVRIDGGGPRGNNDTHCPAGHVLLRRGLPPAVPGEKPRRLLRPQGHRGDLRLDAL